MRIPDFLFTVINPTLRILLRSPLHRLWSRSLLLMKVTGRKSGKVYTIPVRYMRADDEIWVFTMGSNWWKNLRGGAPVRLRIEGKEMPYRAEAVSDDPAAVRKALEAFFAQFPQDTPYYDVRLGPDRRPVESDLELAAKKTVWVRAFPV